MVFSKEQVAKIRSGRISGVLLSVRQNVVAGRAYPLRVRFVQHGENGNETGRATRAVMDPGRDGDAPRPVVITVFRVVDGYLENLGSAEARACGYRTPNALRDSWLQQHPRTSEVRFVAFAVGDYRDRDRFMNWTGRRPGDYTRNPRRAMDPDAPALDERHYAELARSSRQADLAREAKLSEEMKRLTLSERLKRIEQFPGAQSLVARELAVVRQRMIRASGRSRAA